MLDLGLKVLFAYLLGALNGSLVLGKILGGPDVRSFGSGNAGGTNALRARGKWFALGTVLIDVLKGVAAVLWVPGLPLGAPASSLGAEFTVLACGAAAVVGHCYPVWFGFRGGKGGATAVGVLLGVAPAMLLPGLLTWVGIVACTGFVGLATMSAAAVLPLIELARGVPNGWPLLAFLLFVAGFIVFTHRSNIARMRRGEETRMKQLMFLRRST
jgi:glycerol-3-phosphate acyltransferase PlsY